MSNIYSDVLLDTLIYLERSEIGKCQMVSGLWNASIDCKPNFFYKIYYKNLAFKHRLPIRETDIFPSWPQSYFEMYLEKISNRTMGGVCKKCGRTLCIHKNPHFAYLNGGQREKEKLYNNYGSAFRKILKIRV